MASMGEIFGELPLLSAEDGSALLADWLFLNVVDDIKDRVASGDDASRYTLLGLAPLLRKMLTDARPLVSIVRRTHRSAPLEFAAAGFDRPSELDTPSQSGMVLAFAFGGLRKSPDGAAVSLKRFIARPVAWTPAGPVSVRDVIRYYAHVEGGVHLGTPEQDGEYEKTMSFAAPSTLALNLGIINMLLGIARATVTAVEPLVAAILAARPDVRDIGRSSRRPADWPAVARDVGWL